MEKMYWADPKYDLELPAVARLEWRRSTCTRSKRGYPPPSRRRHHRRPSELGTEETLSGGLWGRGRECHAGICCVIDRGVSAGSARPFGQALRWAMIEMARWGNPGVEKWVVQRVNCKCTSIFRIYPLPSSLCLGHPSIIETNRESVRVLYHHLDTTLPKFGQC